MTGNMISGEAANPRIAARYGIGADATQAADSGADHSPRNSASTSRPST